MTEQISVEEYAAKARVFLDANAEKKEARKKFVWGEGTDNVSMFEERSKDAEEEMLRRAKHGKPSVSITVLHGSLVQPNTAAQVLPLPTSARTTR